MIYMLYIYLFCYPVVGLCLFYLYNKINQPIDIITYIIFPGSLYMVDSIFIYLFWVIMSVLYLLYINKKINEVKYYNDKLLQAEIVMVLATIK